MNPHCRIGRVMMKGNVALMPKSRASFVVAEKMREHVEHLIKNGITNLAGFAMVTWDMNGYYQRGIYFRKDSFVGETFLPDFVAAVLRRNMAESAARDVMTGEE